MGYAPVESTGDLEEVIQVDLSNPPLKTDGMFKALEESNSFPLKNKPQRDTLWEKSIDYVPYFRQFL